MGSSERSLVKVRHPAKYTDSIIDVMRSEIEPNSLVFDPFAGTGKIFDAIPNVDWVGMEIEREWADMHPNTLLGNVFTDIPSWWREFFDYIATSPCYGNRYADNHNNQDPHKACGGGGCSKCDWTGISPRHSYKHDLGHDLQPANSGQIQWGEQYRQFHHQAWPLIVDTLAPHGKLILNISNHIRHGQEMHVWEFHVGFLIQHCGLVPKKIHTIDTPRMRKGKNYQSRVNSEYVFVFEKVA